MENKTLRKSLNKAFLKVKPNRLEIEIFKDNLKLLLNRSNDVESEEFHKNLIRDFLQKTYFKNEFFINTKGRNDLVIHNGKQPQSSVGVIIETKRPDNSAEMPNINNLNFKAFQELILYFLRERITLKNNEVKHLIITNNYDWFIFDAHEFETYFAENKKLIKQFKDFEEGRLSGKTTDFFYKEIAKPLIETIQNKIEFIHFNLLDFEKIIKNNDGINDNKLIPLFKIFSAEHLLKLPYVNDSNSLDKKFYNELLHIIGLSEEKKRGTHYINRNKPENRNSASLLENTISQIEAKDILGRIRKKTKYGDTKEEQLFSLSLELCITWINRILFMKLLEAQLVNYHKGDESYKFLSIKKVNNYDDLDSLFFQVLAKNTSERKNIKESFTKIPYLNSSLFEPSEIEYNSLYIGNLKDNLMLSIYSGTILKDANGKKKTGEIETLTYLFEFLDAYDFSSDGVEEIQEENKTLINASVLGLIFEKINGYKDGSFFTPGFITEYMCRETLRSAVIEKFNEINHWKCKTMDDLYDKIEDRNQANKIVNSLKICDPAVGSGHFLVSALNEMLAIKNDLKILQDINGRRLKEYEIIVESDELTITDEDGEPFKYNPKSKESQRVQETLFYEKQTIIENCLFGVDINPNSVKICRLRLWIELLKNAYYKNDMELETLPNIDINIKTGNSLISRFSLDTDIRNALKKSKRTISEYKNAVNKYRNAKNKDEKHELVFLIEDIKTDFKTEVSKNDKKFIRLVKVKGELDIMKNQTSMFEETKAQQKANETKIKKLTKEKEKLKLYIDEINNNKFYQNAFEWRFEFPEVLDKEGNFIGFDTIIGNPPYIQLQKMGEESIILGKQNFETYTKTGDIYSLFYELGKNILKPNGYLAFITSNKWMRASYGKSLRNFFATKTNPKILIDLGGAQVFENATVDTNILQFQKAKNQEKTLSYVVKEKVLKNLSVLIKQKADYCAFTNSDSWVILSPIERSIKQKIEKIGTPLKDWNISINYGIKTGYNDAFIIDAEKRDELIKKDPKSAEIIRPILRGRDIKRYNYDFADLYLITTHNGYTNSAGNKIDRIKVEDYPAIKKHLDQYWERIEKRSDKGATPYNLRNCAYMEDFFKQKIVYPNMTKFLPFLITNEDIVTNQKCFIITGENLFYLVAFFNSSLFKFCFRDNFPELQGGTRELSKVYLENISVKKTSNELNNWFETMITENKLEKNIELLKLIDNKLFDIYDLTTEERNSVGFIEIK